MLSEIKGQLDEYEIANITSENFEQIFNVYDTNQDFFVLTQGEKATIKSSIGDIEALPPNCAFDQKVYIGIWKNGEAVGVLDLIENYPKQSDFWIGLLLVHGNLHGSGLGGKIVNSVLNAAKQVGYKTAQLGVVDNNVKAINFWQRHGFTTLRHNGDILVMEKSVI